jgi:hypothetical protein
LVFISPNQDYASGHAIEGGVGAEVLKQVFGTDGVSFQDCGVKLPAGSGCGDPSPVLRSYSSFSQAANENAFSRILIGFHFRKSIEEGTQYCRKIGARRYQLPPAYALSDTGGVLRGAGWVAIASRRSAALRRARP